MSKLPPVPFSHKVAVATLHGTARVTLVADEAQLKAIARSFRILGVDALSAAFEVAPRHDGALVITGEVRAEARQACIVTLEPVAETIFEPVEIVMAPRPLIETLARRAEEEGRIDDDPPDELVDGEIDLGALATEFLALGLAPFPRKEGAEFGQLDLDAAPLSPFAVLKGLKQD